MTTQAMMHEKVKQELAKFQETMNELSWLKRVSNDLQKYKKMIHLKKFD